MNSNVNANTATSANQNSNVQETSVKGEYAAVNGLKMYYEIHGAGRPLVLLHGSFLAGTVYPTLAEGRQSIVVDMQGHGRTADIDRPFTFEQMADDVAALLKHLKIEQTDVFGFIHNLSLIDFKNFDKDNYGYDWAIEARETINNYLLDGNYEPLINFEKQSKAIRLAIPTADHYLPLIYAIGLQQKGETVNLFNDKLIAGSLSMTSLKIS